MKQGRSKAKGGRTRSLHIKLPADHPIFSLPEGERSRVAREWMEQGRQVLVVMEEIRRDIADIKRNLNRREQCGCKDSDGNEKRNEAINPINPAVFLNL